MEKTEKKVFTVSFERNKKQRHINIIGKDEEEAKSNFWNIIKKRGKEKA